VARWRTSFAAAAVVLVATACGHTERARQAAKTTTLPPSRAQLAVTGQKPLTVKGSGFQANEKVLVSANKTKTRRVQPLADRLPRRVERERADVRRPSPSIGVAVSPD